MILCSANVIAQDVIVKKDGSTIASKVLEINQNEIKYKKFNNQNGPTYSISKSEILSINYENGEKDMFNNYVTPMPQQDYNYTNNQTYNTYSQQNQYKKEQLLISAKHWRNAGTFLGTIIALGGGTVALLCLEGTPAYIVIGSCCGAGFLTAAIMGGVANNKEEQAKAIATFPIIKQDFNIANGQFSAGINLMNDKLTKEHILGLGLALKF